MKSSANEISALAWSKKLYIQQALVYGTICALMALPSFLQPYCSLPIASFLSFFLVVTLRAVFETCFLREIPFMQIARKKILLLSLATAALMTFFLVLIKPKLGWYAIPLSIIFASQIVEKLKAILSPNNVASTSGTLIQLSQKIRYNTAISYGFYLIFVPTTIVLYTYYLMWFFYAIALGYLFGAFFEELCVARVLYSQHLTIQRILKSLFWSGLCAVLAASIIYATMSFFGLEGQPATIIGIVAVKLIQPLRRTLAGGYKL